MINDWTLFNRLVQKRLILVSWKSFTNTLNLSASYFQGFCFFFQFCRHQGGAERWVVRLGVQYSRLCGSSRCRKTYLQWCQWLGHDSCILLHCYMYQYYYLSLLKTNSTVILRRPPDMVSTLTTQPIRSILELWEAGTQFVIYKMVKVRSKHPKTASSHFPPMHYVLISIRRR